VLVAGSPIFGVVFAASVVGLRLEGLHLRSKFSRLTRQELTAMRPTERKAVHRHKAGAQPLPGNDPPPACSGGTWRAVLGLPLNEHRRSVAHQAYRTRARVCHPDHNGSNAAMQIVNDAWKQARKELVLQ
jgi:hypothetical protein